MLYLLTADRDSAQFPEDVGDPEYQPNVFKGMYIEFNTFLHGQVNVYQSSI